MEDVRVEVDAKRVLRSGFPHLRPRMGRKFYVSIMVDDGPYRVHTDNQVLCSRIYVDNRLHYMLVLNIKESFWDRGDFPEVVNNGSDYIVLTDPWVNGTLAAPFDKRVYYFWDSTWQKGVI